MFTCIAVLGSATGSVVFTVLFGTFVAHTINIHKYSITQRGSYSITYEVPLEAMPAVIPGTSAAPWVIITGGGGGIGRALVHHFSRTHRVLTCGRRAAPLRETRCSAPLPDSVIVCACDISCSDGRNAFVSALPAGAPVALLVHNAAIGDPSPIQQLDVGHFEESLRVNVVAPLALSQAFLPHLVRGNGRILHLGTSVAFRPQSGTATYGITKAAFHRLFEQLNAEGTSVPVGSLSPGMVDTEGVRDHVAKARALALPHVAFFDTAFERGWATPLPELMLLVDELLAMDAAEFSKREWRFSEWRKERTKAADYSTARAGLMHSESRAEHPRTSVALLGGFCLGVAATLAASTLARTVQLRSR